MAENQQEDQYYENEFGNEFDNQVEQSDEKFTVEDASMFECQAATAEDSTGTDVMGKGFSRPEEILINEQGKWCVNVPVKNDPGGKKSKNVVLRSKDGSDEMKGMQLFIGDGEEVKETRGWWLVSNIFLTENQCKKVNLALRQLPGCQKQIKTVVTAYGDCRTGITDVNLPVDIYDTIVAGFRLGLPEVTVMNRFKVNLRLINEKIPDSFEPRINQNGVREREKVFRMKSLDSTAFENNLPHQMLKIHVKDFRPVPHTVVKPEIHKERTGRVLRFTGFQARSFKLFEYGMASAYAMSKGDIPVLSVIRPDGELRRDFDAWFRTVVIDVTEGEKEVTTGTKIHPRWWASIKNDRLSKDGKFIVTKGLGVTLWEAINSKHFADALNGKTNSAPFEEDELNNYWHECCGEYLIATSKGRRKIFIDEKNLRKTR